MLYLSPPCTFPLSRSDMVHPAGPLRHRDLVAILPMLDETVVLECTGAQVCIRVPVYYRDLG